MRDSLPLVDDVSEPEIELQGVRTVLPQVDHVCNEKHALTSIASLLANGLFTIVVFASHPRHATGTGSAGWVAPSKGPALERTGSLALVTGWGLQLVSIARPARRCERRWESARVVVAAALLGASLRLAMSAQDALGPAWRTSVAGTGGAPLTTNGPYGLVRHPVYTAIMGVLMANVVVARDRAAAAGAVLSIAALELQVRGLEEPALQAAYGDVYRRYAAKTGRFVPFLGRDSSMR